MALDLVNWEKRAHQSVKKFWASRQGAAKKQTVAGKKDRGERASVTAGRNMDGFLDLIADLVRANGLPDAVITEQRALLTLPGYFRPTKLWDVVVIHQSRLVAAIELKSHIGPSFGNNFNNRAEEAIGTALDFWTAYREGAFGGLTQPFTGWLMLVEDAPGSRSPVKAESPNFPVDPAFVGASYLTRYDLLCQRLVREKLYTTASVIASPRDGKTYVELSEMTGLKPFFTSLAGHVAAEAAR